MPRKSSTASEGLFQLEGLKDYEIRNGTEYFLVKWEGYPDSQNTWEPVSNIVHPSKELQEHMSRLRAAAKANVRKDVKSVRKSAPKKRKAETTIRVTRKSQRLTAPPQPIVCDEDTSPEPDVSRVFGIQTFPDLSYTTMGTQTESEEPSMAFGTQTEAFEPATGAGDTTVTEAETEPVEIPVPDPVLVNEVVVVEQLAKSSSALPVPNQENIPPAFSNETLKVLSCLSAEVQRTSVYKTKAGETSTHTLKEKLPLLQLVETHPRACLDYFLRNVKYNSQETERKCDRPVTPPTQRPVASRAHTSAVPASEKSEAKLRTVG
eukprot:Blabericola_migrator_1__2019@NODE_154_length_12740_cov_225_658329_g135_i0_p5_GENE_NODE_154_length_12740_cov_225_658329_g135_i0NODE_154_length_12740_cov_225_658329_g135_i0_p5_ORF_typecomplete_len320_score67_53Chromo/PF00385_24/7_2e10_NODE_154_length_12740_cov_225_658329_g135_i062327191